MPRNLAASPALSASVLMICCLASGVAAQEPLTLQFVASDDHHRLVENLRADEIQITEDGKPLVLQALRRPSPGGPSQLSILIDSSASESVSLARSGVPELLQAASDSNLQISAWDTARAELLLDFGSGKRALTEALQKADALPEATGSAKSRRILTTAHRLVRDQQVDAWFSLLFALIAEQGGTGGRNEIVFFAPYGAEGSVTQAQIAALASNAMRAGVTVYIVETGGVGTQVETKASVLLTGHKKQPASIPNEWRELAEKTGGLYASATKGDVRDLLRRAGQELTDYYEAAFQPGSQPEDGHFRTIAVNATRPHVDTRHATGYYAAPKLCAFDLAGYEVPLIEALNTGSDDGAPAFDSQVLRFPRHDGKTRVQLIVEIPRGAVTSVEDDAERMRRVHFSVYAQIKSSDGRVLARSSEDVPYETTGEHADKLPQNPFTFESSFLLPNGEYFADLVLSDRVASTVSHHSITFTLPAVDSVVGLGDIVLIRGVQERISDPESPLRFGAQTLVPWVGSEVTRSGTGDLPVLLKLYSDPAISPSPELRLEIVHDQTQVADIPLLLGGGNDGEYQALVWLPEASFPPGHYTFVAHATQGNLLAEQRRDFDFVAPSEANQTLAEASVPDVLPQQLLSPPSNLIAGAKRPTDSEIDSILRTARERALDFKRSLPNFSCVQITKRSARKTGTENWKLKDTIAELVRYSAGREQHEVLEIGNNSGDTDSGQLKGLVTKGEFGAFLDAVFAPEAHAEFTWQGLTLVDGQREHVFAYKVKRANSIYSLSTLDRRSRVNLGFHGTIRVDANTLTTRFVSIEADDVPAQSLYREAMVSVNYGYVMISGQKFLLPKDAELSVRVGKRLLYKDDIAFRDYHRFGATSGLVSRSASLATRKGRN